jgi:hypothetical protein
MMNHFFRSKIAWAILGVIIIGGGSAAYAAASTRGPQAAQSQNTTQAQTSSPTAQPSSATQTPQATATSAPSDDQPPPTDTAPAPTDTPSGPTPTTGPRTVQLSGSVQSVGSSSFVIRSSGVDITINVTSQTRYTGAASSLSGITAGMSAQVQADQHSDGSFWAIAVDTSNGDN